MSKKRILILGAGLSGLSAAWHLQKRGIEYQVFEKEAEVGGLCRSRRIGGFTFDCDGHLLHFRHRYTFNLVKRLLGDNLLRHKRSAWIYAYNRYTPYPFQANLHALPVKVAQECLLGYLRKPLASPDNDRLNFAQWVNRTFGRGIARHFMLPYNTKFWTAPPEDLTCAWLDGFIPVPSLSQVVEGTLKEQPRQFGYNATFWYPKKGGIQQLVQAFAKEIKNIHTGSAVKGIHLKKKEIKLSSGDKERFDYLILTVPLPELTRILNGIPSHILSSFKKLRWNSIFNVNLGINGRDAFKKHWVYFPQKEISFFRMGFFHNFSPDLVPPGKSAVYLEVAYPQSQRINERDIARRMETDLGKLEMLPGNDSICVRDINNIKYGYPIYDQSYHRSRETILTYLLQNNIVPCGRYGAWRYFSMEDSILDGKKIAEGF